jgi:serine/threonine protein kinase
LASEIPPPTTPPEESGGPPAPGDAYERLGILETLCYGVVYDGRVYRASRSEPISLLELHPAFSQDREALNRLNVEIENASGLQDANVLAPKGLYQSGNSFYILSEAQSGISLASAFEMLGILGLRLSAEAVLRLAGSVLAALDSASGSASGRDEAFYCHGLLIPENIFIAEGQRVLIRGFGLWAGGVGRLKLVGPSEARYLTPSQNRAEAASARADLFSLGTILFEAAAGAPAFDAAPDEESVMSLRDSVEELQNQGGASLQALYGIILSCLNANPPIPAFRTKLRTTVDTLFLGELARERVPKTLSLEELLARVRPRRPAVIKARSLALSRFEVAADERPSRAPASSRTPEPPPVASPRASAPTVIPAEETPRPAAQPAPKPVFGAAVESRNAFPTLWVLAIIAVVGITVGLAILKIRPRSERAAITPTAIALASTPVENSHIAPSWPPAALPTEIPSATTPPPTAAEVLPTPEPTTAPRARERPTPRSRPPVVHQRPSAPPAVGKRREAFDRGRSTPAAPSSSSAAAPSAPIAAREPTAVAPGSVVALETPGLTRPSLTTSPEVLRFDSTDARPSVERSVLLQILVDERGRVRANRILRADRIPPGFGQGLERYLATLRFQPGQLGGVAVRVWMPYDLRFYAP